jgi:hypothetical protein
LASQNDLSEAFRRPIFGVESRIAFATSDLALFWSVDDETSLFFFNGFGRLCTKNAN